MKRISKKVFLIVCAALVAVLWLVRMLFPDLFTIDGEHRQQPVAAFVPHRIMSVPSFSTSFPDVQDTQIVAARQFGITPLTDREQMEQRKGELVYVGSCPYYDIDKGMNSSVPYLVPRASMLLGDIARNFLDSLSLKGVPLHKIIVSSVLRTESDVGKLRRGNANASDQSCHRFGTTFDICYNRYETVAPPSEQHRPEFLAGTRVEEQDPRWTHPVDLSWSREAMLDYRDRLMRLSREVDRVNPSVAWMHLVQYPVQGAAQMAQKHVAATLARHGLGSWDDSDLALDSIHALTARYNVGTWDGFMCDAPRDLPVFQKVERTSVSTPLPEEPATLLTARLDATLAPLTADTQPLQFQTRSKKKGQALTVKVSILPTHPRHGEKLCLQVSLDGVDTQTLDFTTYGRSEEWKEGVLQNRATRSLTLRTAKGKDHTLTLSPVSGSEIYPLEVRILPAD